ncbi:MAG: SDR family NAD(P)-dependent oxidoreductase [Myxococcota bacterium]
MTKLAGKVAFITGAGRGVGRGIAFALAKQGADIAIAELDPETGPATARDLEALGVRAIAPPCDVTDRAQVDAAVAQTVETLGGLDILVNNATGARQETAFRSLMKHTEEQVELQLAVDVRGSFSCMQACYPHLSASERGRVVNICSMSGTERAPGFAIYAAAKEALRALTGVAAREWGRKGITVNAVCPTAATEANQRWAAENPETFQRHLATVPLGREGDPERDIGRAVAFLASEDADFITGQTLWVDGGAVIHA